MALVHLGLTASLPGFFRYAAFVNGCVLYRTLQTVCPGLASPANAAGERSGLNLLPVSRLAAQHGTVLPVGTSAPRERAAIHVVRRIA